MNFFMIAVIHKLKLWFLQHVLEHMLSFFILFCSFKYYISYLRVCTIFHIIDALDVRLVMFHYSPLCILLCCYTPFIPTSQYFSFPHLLGNLVAFSLFPILRNHSSLALHLISKYFLLFHPRYYFLLPYVMYRCREKCIIVKYLSYEIANV